MNEENEWNQIADTVERVIREEIMEAFKHLKIGALANIYAKIILAS